ncbi:MAG: hypothetical protein ABIH72_05755 [archaeon]
MKFYISAKWQLVEEVRKIHKLLKEKGHEITEDWTLHNCVKPYDKDVKVSNELAKKDIQGVLNADVYVLLSDNKGIGKYIELGAALASNVLAGKPLIYVIGSLNNQSQFYFHPEVRLKRNFDEVLEEVDKLGVK